MKRPNSQEMEDFEQSFDEICVKMDLLKKRLRKEESEEVNNDNGSAVNEFCTSTTPKTAVGSLGSTQFITNSILYTSAKEDQQTVNLITKKFDEFSNICSENGLNLVIQQEADNGVTIRLIQSSATFSSRKAFKELDDLVKRKSERDEEMEVRYQKFVDDLRTESRTQIQRMEGNWKEETGSWKKEKEETDKKLETYKNLIDQQAEKISNLEGIVSSQEALFTKMSINSFLEERNVKTIRETPILLEKVCKTLSEKLNANRGPPLEFIETVEEKKKILREYLDFLQIKAKSTDIQLKISEFILDNKLSFVWKSTEEEKIKASSEMKEKFQLDNVVGTIHTFSSMNVNNGCTFAMYLAIVGKKIVDWVYDKKGVNVICETLLENLKPRFFNYKFAAQFKVEDKYSDVFVEMTNTDVFLENAKVITWIKNNFDCLKDGINTCYDHYVFPALYNMSLEHILNSQSALVSGTNGPI